MKNSDVRVVFISDEEDDILVIIQVKQWEDSELSQIINYLAGGKWLTKRDN